MSLNIRFTTFYKGEQVSFTTLDQITNPSLHDILQQELLTFSQSLREMALRSLISDTAGESLAQMAHISFFSTTPAPISSEHDPDA
ncbi:hypothetical protein [Sulfoacidibacillus thermotolerans]|uniref:hypothetical protein n=1 Tax=Sulfoacidibacillus thermotolerans TaxID=1765684 RepID=UPI0011B1C816|nr:hypothetical protein [Sulfoacidibacillus thermotolerans]